MVAAEAWRETAILTGVTVVYDDDPAPFLDEHDLATVRAVDPLRDLSDCRHGCNGDCIARGTGSEVCDFTCHPGLEPMEPA